METVTLTQAILSKLIDSVPYIVGGLLAVAGGALAQALTHVFAGKRERSNHLRDQLAEYVHLLSDDSSWLHRARVAYLFGDGVVPETPEPWDRAHAISTLYFSIGAIEAPFLTARHTLWKAMGEAYVNRLEAVASGKAPSLTQSPPDFAMVKKVTDAYGPYLEARKNLLVACRELAKSSRASG